MVRHFSYSYRVCRSYYGSIQIFLGRYRNLELLHPMSKLLLLRGTRSTHLPTPNYHHRLTKVRERLHYGLKQSDDCYG